MDREFIAQCPRAYVVSDSTEDRSVVVYARNPMEARRLGHFQDDLGAMDYEFELHVRRAPEFDELGGRPLLELQLENDWWFECWHCAARVTQDEERYDAEGREYTIEPTVYAGGVFCSPWCAGAYTAEFVERRARNWRAIEAAVEKFPGCRIESVSCSSYNQAHELTGSVAFTLPPYHSVLFRWSPGDKTMDLYPDQLPVWRQYKELACHIG